MAGAASKLVQDLNSVPAIVGALGVNISEAQKAFNLDYMDNLERLLGLIKSMLEPTAAGGEERTVSVGDNATIVKELLMQLAPSRYQFTETTLDVKMDLGQTMDVVGTGGFSAGFSAVAVNAAMTVGFGYDYRAAAEVRTVLHAIPASKDVMTALLNRAGALDSRVLQLPTGAQVDKEIVDKTHAILSKLVGTDVQTPEQPVE
jgi:hypothetical protein